jgi:hypothetical protein
MKEKIGRNKIIATAIVLLLSLSIVASFSPANGSTTTIMHTSYTYCSVGNSVIGLGQDQILVFWTADIPPDIGETEGIIAGAFNRAGWIGVSFNVTSPSGTTTNIPIALGQTDSIGGGYIVYSPTELGVYTVVAIFPAQWKNTTLVNGASTPKQTGYPDIYHQYYSADNSAPVTFTVQSEAIPTWNESPLPNDYWTRPINDASRSWSQLGGNWLQGTTSSGAWLQPAGQAGGTTTRFVYGQGTETSHILWTRQYYVGGYMDSRFGEVGYETGHYQGMDFTAIILNGRIYYENRADAYVKQGFNVVDLYSGELLGYYNETIPTYGQIYNYDSPNQHGGYSFLWRTASGFSPANGTVLEMLDGYALPLRHICYVANASTGGTNVVGNNGEMLWYNIAAKGSNWYLTCWNNTNIAGFTDTPTSGTGYWQWRPEGGGGGGYTGKVVSNGYVYDGSTGFTINTSIAAPLNAPNSILNQTGSIQAVRVGDSNGKDGFIIIGTSGQNNEIADVKGQLWCYSLERGQQGKQLWATSFSAPYATTDSNASISLVGVYPEDGVILYRSAKMLKYWAIDMKTGAPLWESQPEPDNNYYSMQYNYYKGEFLTTGYGGVCISYNITTGKQLWNYTLTNIGGESPYGNYPVNIFAICDDKIYLLSGEHSITQPMWRGPNLRCINALTGTEIWKIMGMSADNGAHLTGLYAQMGDGKVVALNYYDNQLYCIGRGSSKTTVSTPQTASPLGSTITISGTVTDATKSGKRNTNNLIDFTLEGTPAVSDDSMSAWMEYLFMGQAKPTNTTGVPVSINTIDPNGNSLHIGDTTSDEAGNFALKYQPEIPGTYKIIATFEGSNSYGSSFGTAYLTAAEASTSVTPTATPLPQSTADQYFIPAVIGIILTIIIVGAILGILLLRKRP